MDATLGCGGCGNMAGPEPSATARTLDSPAVLERVVALARSERPDYGAPERAVPAPELPSGEARTIAQSTLRDLFHTWGLDPDRAETPSWNPLGALLAPGARVVLKPNWVTHWNRSGQGLDCLVTHTSVIAAVLEYVALARPARAVLGDAPVQGCDFEALRQVCQLDELVARFRSRGLDLTLCDFRRTVLPGDRLGAKRVADRRGMEHYVLFDLKEDSLLEPLGRDADRFRVTMYDPDLMAHTHAPGRHQYLVAREVIEADAVINLPKLKAHKKAGITGALKNLVGINSDKECLPHHRKGGAASGGDCYAGRSWLKCRAEDLLDAANRAKHGAAQAALARSAQWALGLARLFGADGNVEGSWYGNDTVWRMTLDLQRILRYGRMDGTLAPVPQRKLISLTDAIVAGEAEGPLAPSPVPAGFLSGALNPAAAEWVHARLMGFDPRKIPLVRQALTGFRYPLADFPPEAIAVRFEGRERPAEHIFPFSGRAFRPPRGWQRHCELESCDDRASGDQTLVA